MLVALLITACGVATAADAQRRQTPIVTWGKAGVSLDEYRADSIACASEA